VSGDRPPPRIVRDESDAERHDRQLGELLQELRVALPGVQVLFAFLLTVPFSARFADASPFQRDVYFATLLLTAAATVLLMAPTAIHRWLFRRGMKGGIVEIGHRLTLAGLGLLALAIAGAVILVTDVLFTATAAVVVGVIVIVVTAVLWAVVPWVYARRTGGRA
jgi:O-antigen/teichoic acid export membrane protein